MRASISFLLALSLAACTKSPKDKPGPAASASTPSSTASTAASAPTATGAADAGAPEHPPDQPFAPKTETAASDDVHKQIGTLKDWIKAYDGSGSLETTPPPQLRLPKELGLKSGKLALERSGDLFIFDFATQTESRLTQRQQRNVRPLFFHDGRRLAFLSNRDGMSYRAFIAATDGGSAKPVTPRFKEPFEIAISPDDKTLAYVAEAPGHVAMHLVDLESGRDDTLAEPVLGEFEGLKHPTFSPSGDELYFVTHAWDDEKIYAADTASRLVRKVVKGLWWNGPQKMGERVLFAAGGSQSYCCREMRLMTMEKNGADIKGLPIPFNEYGSIYPKLSPKGTKIAAEWNARLGGLGADWRLEISIIQADGRGEHMLGARFPHPFYSAVDPSWAPDDRHLAFTLSLCPYMGCEPTIRSVVVVDAEDPNAVPAFIGYGGESAFSPVL